MFQKPLKIVLAAVFAAVLLLAPTGVYAQTDGSADGPDAPRSSSDVIVQEQPVDEGEPSDTRTSQSNAQACRNVESNAVNHMGRLSDLTQRHLELFSTISERVDEFYQENELQAEGYDAQMEDIAALVTDTRDLSDGLRLSTDDFECGQENNVRQQVSDFRASFQESKDLLSELRQAVREQILLVKDALSDSEATDEGEENLETSEAEDAGE